MVDKVRSFADGGLLRSGQSGHDNILRASFLQQRPVEQLPSDPIGKRYLSGTK